MLECYIVRILLECKNYTLAHTHTNMSQRSLQNWLNVLMRCQTAEKWILFPGYNQSHCMRLMVLEICKKTMLKIFWCQTDRIYLSCLYFLVSFHMLHSTPKILEQTKLINGFNIAPKHQSSSPKAPNNLVCIYVALKVGFLQTNNWTGQFWKCNLLLLPRVLIIRSYLLNWECSNWPYS